MDDFETHYPMVTITRRFAGREFSLRCVRDQDALLSGIGSEAEVEAFPFGLLLWASAIGLAEHLTEHPHEVRDKRVLEIGAGGVGLPGMVAATLGACAVLQTDYHAEALALLQHNTVRNGFAQRIQRMRGDWRDFSGVGEPFDVVIGSDVLYERTLHETLLSLLPRLVKPGGLLVLSDPLRPHALSFVERLERSGGADWEMPVAITGRRVQESDGTTSDVALFRAVRKG